MVFDDGDAAELPRLDVRQYRREMQDAHVHVAAEQVGQRLRPAFVADLRERRAERLRERGAGQVLKLARARGDVFELPGILFAVIDQRFHVLRGTDGWTTITVVEVTAATIGVRSFTGSKGAFFSVSGIRYRPPEVTSSV